MEKQEIFEQKLDTLISKDHWIIDGNYTRTAPMRFARADTVFFFDLPVWLCLYRILKRTALGYGHTRADMADGCTERFNWDFTKYVARFKKETRPRIIDALEEHAKHCQVIIFKTPKDVRNWKKNDPHKKII